MQKFKEKIKDSPRDTSHVPCSETCQLNKEEILSVDEKALSLNNSEGNHRKHISGSELRLQNIVYVQNMRGKPLMPTNQSTARRLIKNGKAKIIKRTPFTIQLTTATGETKQDLTLGVDTGYKSVGVSVVSVKKELISAEIQLRTDISDKLIERKMYRRGRRNKLWYRKPRWENRANAKQEGRLMPSVKQKVESHIKIIEKIKKLLPISKLIIETGLFDMANMENNKIRGTNHQKGEMFGFENIKAYVLSRDNHKCFFNKSNCSSKLQVHHIKFKSEGGTNNPNNLITLCEKCHEQLHEGKLTLNIKQHKELKSATIMNIIRKRILTYFSDAVETFGYETKIKIRELKIDKSHTNDAFVIVNGSNQERIKSFKIIQKRKNNRCLQLNRKGFKPSIKRNRSTIQPLDSFWVKGKQYICKGMHSYGRYICYGSTKLKEYFKIEEVEKYFNQGSLVWD